MILSIYLKIVPIAFLSLLITPEKNTTPYTLIVFEGSDWCVNCIRLEKNVLQTKEFLNYAEKNNITIERVDFPQRKKLEPTVAARNAQLAETYNFNGEFPTILFISNNEERVVKLSNFYNSNARLFIDQLEKKIQASEWNDLLDDAG